MSVTTTDGNGGLLNFIERASRDPEFDVAKFESLLRMQREIVHEQGRREFNQAMSAAQTAMAPIVRDAQNTHTNSKYAKLETIDREMRPIYTSHGFAVRYGSAEPVHDGWIRITCTVSHVGGYAETHFLDSPPDTAGSQGKANKTPVQAVGSSISYLRRYLLTMAFNIVLADDDNDGQTRRPPPPRPTREPQQAAPQQQQPTTREWFDRFEQECGAAQSRDQAQLILNRFPGGQPPEWMANMPNALQRFAKVREDMIARLWGEPAAPDATAPDLGAPDTTNNGETLQWPDEAAELIAQVVEMDLPTIETLQQNKAWLAKTRELFPPDQDRVNEAITERKAYLRQSRQ